MPLLLRTDDGCNEDADESIMLYISVFVMELSDISMEIEIRTEACGTSCTYQAILSLGRPKCLRAQCVAA